VTIDLRIVIFTSTITILTGLVFGLLPALTGSRSDLNTHLKEGGRTGIGSGRSNLNRKVLVAIEVALSVILVIGAGVMLRSLGNMRKIDTGFRTEDVLTMRLSFPDGSAEAREPIAFYEQVLEEVRALPGVTGAGVVSRLPLSQTMGTASIQVEGRVVATIGEAPGSEVQQLTPGYFEAMDVTILEGRGITPADNADNRPVVVVNQAFARKHWPGESAIGRRIKLFAPRLPWLEIVGIAGDVRHNGLLAEPRPKMYIPHAQSGESAYGIAQTMNLVVHGESVERLAAPIRSIVSHVNSSVPVYRVQTMQEVKSAAMVGRTYPTLLLTLFGLLALFLASIGIYGLVAFQVNQGSHDIGIHMALGATRGHVRQMVVGKGLIPVFLGIAVGLTGAVGLTRMLNSLLYEVSSLDLPVYLGVSAILLLVATTACLLPAVNATRLDPVVALRSE
jgi:predicted permease